VTAILTEQDILKFKKMHVSALSGGRNYNNCFSVTTKLVWHILQFVTQRPVKTQIQYIDNMLISADVSTQLIIGRALSILALRITINLVKDSFMTPYVIDLCTILSVPTVELLYIVFTEQ